MKNLLLILTILTCSNIALSQNEFGAIGSRWIYNHEPHNGNGGGWDMISIVGDTVIDNEIYQQLRRTFFRYQSLPPTDTTQGTYIYGLMQIKNDSVLVNGQLIIDFGMEVNDTIVISPPETGIDLYLTVDSINRKVINGIEHKNWHGMKLCPEAPAPIPYENYELIEDIGQVGSEYLFWNTDGCIIGGGTNTFQCYKNGGFVYPETSDCEERILVNIEELEKINQIKFSPNPIESKLKVTTSIKYESYGIVGLSGEKLFSQKVNSREMNLDLSSLLPGTYFIMFNTKRKTDIRKIIKK